MLKRRKRTATCRFAERSIYNAVNLKNLVVYGDSTVDYLQNVPAEKLEFLGIWATAFEKLKLASIFNTPRPRLRTLVVQGAMMDSKDMSAFMKMAPQNLPSLSDLQLTVHCDNWKWCHSLDRISQLTRLELDGKIAKKDIEPLAASIARLSHLKALLLGCGHYLEQMYPLECLRNKHCLENLVSFGVRPWDVLGDAVVAGLTDTSEECPNLKTLVLSEAVDSFDLFELLNKVGLAGGWPHLETVVVSTEELKLNRVEEVLKKGWPKIKVVAPPYTELLIDTFDEFLINM